MSTEPQLQTWHRASAAKAKRWLLLLGRTKLRSTSKYYHFLSDTLLVRQIGLRDLSQDPTSPCSRSISQTTCCSSLPDYSHDFSLSTLATLTTPLPQPPPQHEPGFRGLDLPFPSSRFPSHMQEGAEGLGSPEALRGPGGLPQDHHTIYQLLTNCWSNLAIRSCYNTQHVI